MRLKYFRNRDFTKFNFSLEEFFEEVLLVKNHEIEFGNHKTFFRINFSIDKVKVQR